MVRSLHPVIQAILRGPNPLRGECAKLVGGRCLRSGRDLCGGADRGLGCRVAGCGEPDVLGGGAEPRARPAR